MEQQELTTPDRRSVMQVCGLISLGLLGVPTLVACGSDDESSDSGGTAAAGAAGTVLAKLADIPVGGALVTKGADGKPVALIQATAGAVTAVSAVCPTRARPSPRRAGSWTARHTARSSVSTAP